VSDRAQRLKEELRANADDCAEEFKAQALERQDAATSQTGTRRNSSR